MRSYETDTTENQWARIAFCFTQPEGGPGRKRTIDTRRVVDALFYRMRTGCQWRFMPRDFPPLPLRPLLRHEVDPRRHDRVGPPLVA